jgi:hypothetical protein
MLSSGQQFMANVGGGQGKLLQAITIGGPVIDRIEKLERQNRLLRTMCLLSFALSGGVFLIAAKSEHDVTFDTITAHTILLRGTKGVIGLGVDNDGPSLLMKTTEKTGSSFYLSVGPDETFMRMRGSDPSYGVNLSSGSDQTLLEYGSGLEDRRVWLQATKGSSSLSLYGKDSQNLYLSSFMGLFISHPEGDAFFNVYDRGPEISLHRKVAEKSQHSVTMGVTEEGPFAKLADKDGFAAQLGTVGLVTPRTGEQHQRSAASLVFFSKANVLWSAP